MRIVIDMQGAQASNAFRGIGRYTMALSKAIVRNCKKHEVILALNGAFPESLDRIYSSFSNVLPRENIKVWYPVVPTAYLEQQNDIRRKANECVRKAFFASLAPDVVLVSSLFEGLGDDAVTEIESCIDGFITATVLYDLIPYIHQNPYLENPDVKKWYLEKIDFLKKSDLCLAISESSRLEGVNYLSLDDAKCIGISTDADEQFRKVKMAPVEIVEVKKKYGIKNNFVMYTGGIDFRKNIEGLIRAYSLLAKQVRQQYQLAIICSIQEDSRKKLLSLVEKCGLDEAEVILTGFVPEEDLIALYNCCSLFVFPSWHEGFGLPALEAMRCGAPVIASNLSSLPEVVGMEEALFDPYSDQAIAQLMQRALTDKKFNQKLVQNAESRSQRFSWDITAQRAIEAMEKAVIEKQKNNLKCSGSTVKSKLAYVSPLPSERSGISDYSAELLPVLSEYYQIEVIIEQEEITDDWIKKHCQVRTVDWFMKNAHSYDRVLYHFGNSHFHQHMFSMLCSVPGVVVLHDFFLSGIVHYMEATGNTSGFFTQELYKSHGYSALQEMSQAQDISDMVWKYPASRGVLENSIGAIVHSENSVHLAEKWYQLDKSALRIIPHLRAPEANLDFQNARLSLDFGLDDFIVCSFGLLGPSKLNHRLLQAWFDSVLAKEKNCYLVFVGQNHEGEYGEVLVRSISKSGCEKRIRITGWASKCLFKKYLTAANIGVQLRSLSRGETSGTVLDCMNYGLPTIVNANGSMADLDKKTVWMLPDDFKDEELTEALETLWHESEVRKKLGSNAKEKILKDHDPNRCAHLYFEAIEGFYKEKSPDLFKLYPKLASILSESNTDIDLHCLANNLSLTFPNKYRQKQLLIDISELVQRDAKTGIQRVVRSILHEWLAKPPAGFRVEPVYATVDTGYRYARQFVSSFIGASSINLIDEPIDYAPGDIFFALDLQPQVQVAHRDFYQHLSRHGVKVTFMVYDLLCIQMPQYFVEGGSAGHTQWLNSVAVADSAICISNSVAVELQDWMKSNAADKLEMFSIDWFHLGADIDNTQPSQGLPHEAGATLASLQSCPSFLMVGTLEPRKGHLQVLEAFEELWRQGQQINLVFVGKQGWLVDELVERLRHHPELNKRLFWLEGISDEYLEKVYATSTCLIAASYGEGFGLPLIEAAQHKLPILARDIPVFREVAGEHASYFTAEQPEQLADTVRQWLELYKQGAHPKSDQMPWLTWEQSAKNLIDLIVQ